MRVLRLSGSTLTGWRGGRCTGESAFPSDVEGLPEAVERCLGRPGRLGSASLALHLGPPWVQIRRIPQLDGMPLEEVRKLVEGRPDRFFRLLEKGWITAVGRTERGAGGLSMIAAAVPSGLVASLGAAVSSLGWRLAKVGPDEISVPLDLRLPEQKRRQRNAEAGRLAGAVGALIVAAYLGLLTDLFALRGHEQDLRARIDERKPAVAAVMEARAAAAPQLVATVLRDSLSGRRHSQLHRLLQAIRTIPADAHLTSLFLDAASARIEGLAVEPLTVRAALDTLPWLAAGASSGPLWVGQVAAGGRRAFSIVLNLEPAR